MEKRKGKSNKKKKRKKNRFIKRFLNIVFSILTIYFILLIGFFVYAYISDTNNKNGNSNNIINNVVDKIKPTLPERTIGLLACTDEGEGRTDAIMIVSYNSVNNKISLLSIPRDTRVTVPNYMWEVMVQNFPILKSYSPTMKINAIPNYGKDKGMEFLQTTLEDILDIKIDYYAHFNFKGFRYIIDSVGGIEFDVPQRMYYNDPTQDLYINLKPGLQFLDGAKAEQLLRFRSYPQGDLKRVEVQQAFIKEFLKKIVNVNSIISNPKAYFTTLTEYLNTNFGISDGIKYMSELKEIDITNVENYTLPCTPQNINGISYVIIDDNKVKEFAYEILKRPTVRPEDIVYEDSYDKSITILNGSYTKGIAGNAKKLLESKGYIIGDIGDYLDSKSKETKIFVSKEGQGNDLQKFFTNSKINVNQIKINEYGYDIVIVIGTEEKLNLKELEENHTEITSLK